MGWRWVLQLLTERLPESALDGEITDHFGLWQARPDRSWDGKFAHRHPVEDCAHRRRSVEHTVPRPQWQL